MCGPTAAAVSCGTGTLLVDGACTVDAAATCGVGTVMIAGICTMPAVSTFCSTGTMFTDGGCVPDCADLRRRSIDCPQCNGPPTIQAPTTRTPTSVGETISPTAAPAIATTGPDPGSETATGDGDDAGVGTVVAVGIVIFLLGACAGALVMWKKKGGSTQPSRPAGVENAMYGKPDGFGFAPVQGGSGYIEVEGKPGPEAK